MHTSVFTCPSVSEGVRTCLWEELGNCEETSAIKPRSSKEQSSTGDTLGVQGTGMKTLKVKVIRFKIGMRTNLYVDWIICVLNCDK